MTTQHIRFRGLSFLGYPHYKVGTDGSVWSKAWGYWVKRTPSVHNNGRLYVSLSNEGVTKIFGVAQLVLLCFVGPRPPRHEVCHFPDRDVSNNALENLRWGTHSSNLLDRVFHGTDRSGEKGTSVKVTESQVVKMHQLRAIGWTYVRIGQKYGLTGEAVSKAVNGRTWKKVYQTVLSSRGMVVL